MDVKAAVALAKHKIEELFADEGIKNSGLEEVDFDLSEGDWKVTIGFSRPWDEPRNALAALAGQTSCRRRAYKVVRIKEDTEAVPSVRSLEEKV